MSNQSIRTGGANLRGDRLAKYIAAAPTRNFPPEIVDAAKKALVDFVGVAIGAANEPVVGAARRVAKSWNAAGNAQVFLGWRTTPALAALVNSTMVHAMDFDDTHPGGTGHPSGPCWSTALALAGHYDLSEDSAIAGFVTGFEVMAKLGGGGPPGVGRSLQRRGLHPTSVFGRAGAAAAACAMLRHGEDQVSHAMGIAATTAGGLLGSFGTHSKPFHSGKAAMDGILAAQLAAEGFEAATHLYELGDGILAAFIQDGEVDVPELDFDETWELLGNGYKPFACCRATQPSTQAAQALAAQIDGREISRVHARVHPNALVTAGKLNPHTPLEGKFSVPFCVALGLRGYKALATDFNERVMTDPDVMDLVPRVELEPVDGQSPHSAHLDVYLEDGTHLQSKTDIVLGHPDNPMDWPDLRTKFDGLVEPELGPQRTEILFACLRNFDAPGSLDKMMAILDRSPP